MTTGNATVSPWMAGAVAPVHQEVTANGLEVHGAIPDELCGRFVKIGPNPITPPRSARYRVFLADGMVHGVRLCEGQAMWYHNRWIRSRRASRVLGEAPVPGPRHSVVDNVNTHVIGHAGRTLALVEAGCTPAELGYQLDTIRYTDFEGTLRGGFSPHPKRDPHSGELHAITYRPVSRHVKYVVLGTDALVKKIIRIPVTATPIMHDMGLTENYVILFDTPARITVNPLRLFTGRVYQWKPSHPTRFGVLPRNGSGEDIRWYETDQCFILHTLNAYEKNARIIIDGTRYDRVMDETVSEQRPKSYLWRWIIDPATGIVRHHPIDDTYEEFPRINDCWTTLQNRFSYTLGLEEPPGTEPVTIIKRDLETGETKIRKFPGCQHPSEPVFVPRANAVAEDDGWIMTYVTDLATDRTNLTIYRAQDPTSEPVAVIELPVRVPTCFHGSWIPDGT